jgi:PEP-CTERM motif-containing protein
MNPKRVRLSIATVAVLSALLLPLASQADIINFTLTQPSQTGSPGTTLDFQGTLSNPTANPIFLNADSSTTAALFLTVDDTAFLLNAPASLAPNGSPGSSVGPIDLFTVTIGASAVSGTYVNNFFTVEGGGDASTFNALATQQFAITVGTPVPEPGTMALLGTGIALVVGEALRRRRTPCTPATPESPRRCSTRRTGRRRPRTSSQVEPALRT